MLTTTCCHPLCQSMCTAEISRVLIESVPNEYSMNSTLARLSRNCLPARTLPAVIYRVSLCRLLFSQPPTPNSSPPTPLCLCLVSSFS